MSTPEPPVPPPSPDLFVPEGGSGVSELYREFFVRALRAIWPPARRRRRAQM